MAKAAPAHHDHGGGPGGPRHLEHEQAEQPRPEDRHARAGTQPGPAGGMHRQRTLC